jgi:type IV pilus assembly protein PilY1
MHIQTTLLTAAITFASALAGVAQATPVDGTINLLTTPPELTAKVAPNVVLTFDDSGSMGRNYMPDARPYTGAGWGATDSQNTAGSQSYGSGAGPYLCAGIIDPRITDPLDPRSWSMNGVYYNPNATYNPPQRVDGSEFPDAPFNAAWDNGVIANRPDSPVASTTRNLGTNTRFCGNTAGYYRYKSTAPAITLNAAGKISNTGTLYTASNWEWVTLPAAEQQNFANWYSYYHTRYLASMTAVSRAYATFDRGIRVAWQNINNRRLATATGIYPFEDVAGRTTKTDFYTWLFSTPVSGNTPNQRAANDVGNFFRRNTGTADTNPYWDRDIGRELSCRKNFHIQMTDGLWNNSVITVANTDTTPVTLPDGRSFATSELQSKIYWNEGGPSQQTMANIAFHYWATDLRPDFQNNAQTKLKVRPYLADRTTGITGSAPLNPGDNWLDNKEVYWNPANNPASWPHLVQYMIGFGVDGTIPKSDANYLRLREGLEQWPALDGTGTYTDNGKKIDDMWHAAINSRGQFFAAANPEELIDAIRKIIASVVAQSTSSTPASVSLPILTGGNSFYEGGYDSSGWLGSLRRRSIDTTGTPGAAVWDAGCLLTGGQCADPTGSGTARDPNSRILFTSDGAGVGKAFRWGSLTNPQKYALNQKPGAAACASAGTSTTCDGHGSARVDYVRGDRTKESATTTPSLRSRLSVLGSIINAEPVYVSSPRAGYRDMFPVGSPEATAAALSEGSSYAGYQNAERDRRPTVYAGSNDGMLHAFDAKTGKEQWAYVPDLLIRNGRLHTMTLRDSDLVPGVDSAARERDVFINGSWRTILLGSLRLGGRGVYALDVTDPEQAGESNSVALWEFTSGNVASTAGDAPCAAGVRSCPSLGYTYDSANVARIKYDNKWVAVVSSGYFPENADAAAKPADATEAAAKRTSLLVIDLETGLLIREIRTSGAPETRPAGFLSYGLSTPMVYDEGSDQIDDLVYAGDLAGNLWRFDLSDANPANWKVNLMFTTYGSTGGATAAGNQPIVFNPTAMRDPVTRRPILVVGTGKYLGEPDRTSLIPQQSFYGIRDYGTNSTNYPIRVEQLVTQNISQTGSERRVTSYTVPSSSPGSSAPVMRMASKNAANNPIVTDVRAHGWRMPLNIATERGERSQRRAIPLTTANVTLLYGLIPKSDDPCDPGARYSVMALDGATGAALAMGAGEIAGTGQGIIGGVAQAPSPPADPVMVRGGGKLVIPGLSDQLSDAVKDALNAGAPPWHRGAWRDLLNW